MAIDLTMQPPNAQAPQQSAPDVIPGATPQAPALGEGAPVAPNPTPSPVSLPGLGQPDAPQKPYVERFFDAFNAGVKSNATYSVDPKTGAITKNPGNPADWSRNILGAAMSALGRVGDANARAQEEVANTKFDAGTNGRALGAAYGSTAENEIAKANDQTAFKRAQDQSENVVKSQDVILRQAAEAREQIDSVIRQHKWDMEKHDYDANEVDKAILRKNQNTQLGAEPLKIAGEAVPEFDNTEDATKFINGHPEAFHNNYKWQMERDPDTNKIQIWQRPPNYDDRMDRKVTYADGTSEVLPSATGKEAELALTNKDEMLKVKADLGKDANSPPTDTQMKVFTEKILPSYTHIPKAQRDALADEVSQAKTVADFDKISAKAFSSEQSFLIHEDTVANTKAQTENKFAEAGLTANEKIWNDPQHGYAGTLAQAKLGRDAIVAGADGNGLLTSMVPTMEVMGVNHAAGISRISPAEAAAAGAPGGWAERWNAWATKAVQGKLTPELAKEGQQLFSILVAAKYAQSIKSSQLTAAGHNLQHQNVPVMDVNGNVTTLDKVENSIPGIKANPVYANAPGKPRMMSIDGGKTWQTVPAQPQQ